MAFRPMRRHKQQVETAVCQEILAKAPRGVLAVSGDDNYPYAVPVNFYYDAAKNAIYFHTAKEGNKVDAFRRNPKVSFCVYNEGYVPEGDFALTITSVISFGTIRELTDPAERYETARQLGTKMYPSPEILEQNLKAVDRMLAWELTIEHMTGKKITER